MEHTKWRKNELVKSNTLESWSRWILLGERECSRQESEPLELHRRHEKAISHESRQTLEIERRHRAPDISQFPHSRGLVLVNVGDLYRKEVVSACLRPAGPEGRNQLRNGIGNTTKHL